MYENCMIDPEQISETTYSLQGSWPWAMAAAQSQPAMVFLQVALAPVLFLFPEEQGKMANRQSIP
jgi:hypothetical protein